MSVSLFFGEGAVASPPEAERLAWSEYPRLIDWEKTEKELPSQVLLCSEQVSAQGTTVEKILALCQRLRVPVVLSSPNPGEYERVLTALLGIPLGETTDLSFASARPEEVFLSSAHLLLSGSYDLVGNLETLLLHLKRVLSFFAELPLVLFSLKTASGLKIYAGTDPSLEQPGFDYFLRFCKQDLVLQDRFVSVESVDVRFLEGRPAPGRPGRDLYPSSYTRFPLKDTQGRVLGLVHLGSWRNHYFNEKVVSRLSALLPYFGSVISLAIRRQDLADRKRGLLNLFAKFLPEPVIKRLLEEKRSAGDLAGKRTRAVILFSDIRSFTTITERNGAEPVVQFLNGHFQAMVSQISAQGGVVDKFIGDAIVAVFNADSDEEDACARAVRAARNMLRELPRVDVSSVVLDNGKYGIGVGLHVGEAVAGSIGSSEKAAYTVIGKIIEHAEELEAETKHYRVGMLMSHSVASAVKAPDLALIDVSEDPSAEITEHLYTLDLSAGG